MMTDHSDYLRDLVVLLLARAVDSSAASTRDGDDGFEAGRAMAYAEVLDLMKKQAEAFLIPPEELGLQQFDMVAFLPQRAGARTRRDHRGVERDVSRGDGEVPE